MHMLSRDLRKFNLQHAYHSVNRIPIRDLFPSSIYSIPSIDMNRVYRLECAVCFTIYIGQTGRKLKNRVEGRRSAKSCLRALQFCCSPPALRPLFF